MSVTEDNYQWNRWSVTRINHSVLVVPVPVAHGCAVVAVAVLVVEISQCIHSVVPVVHSPLCVVAAAAVLVELSH